MRLPSSHELFDLTKTAARELLLSVRYPHEALDLFGEWLSDFLKTKGRNFQELSDGLYAENGSFVHPSVITEGLCVIEEGATVRHGTYLRGPLLIGRGATVGGGCEVKGCILFDGATLAHFNYAGDSIIGAKAHLGSHAVISNLRADRIGVKIKTDEGLLDTKRRKLGAVVGDGAEIGCGAVLCPGSYVGKQAIVYPISRVRGVVGELEIYKGEGNIAKREL